MRKILFILLMPVFCFAQNNITEKTKSMEFKKGYFNYYWDNANGKIYLVMTIVSIILFGLFIYVASVDKKLTQLENK